MYDLCVFVCIKLLFTYLLTYLLRGTDKRTHGQSERLMPPASIYISNRTGKTGTKIRCPFERGLALRPKSQTTSLQSLFWIWDKNGCRYSWQVNRTLVLQPDASRCWSSRMLMGLTSSIVRGRSLKSGSTTHEATTGSATTCCISWQRTENATSWGSTCRQSMVPGTTPNTVRSRCRMRQTATSWRYPGSQVTIETLYVL